MPFVLLGIIVLMLLIGIGMYNSLIGRKNQVDNAFGAIDAILKKRHDLLPNLVEVVKRYMSHERDTLTEITAMRAKAISPDADGNTKMDIGNKISSKMGGLMVAVENYPDLKANTNFLQLQGAWNEVEEQLQAARRSYNASVTRYNNGVEMFPTSIFANMLGYQTKPVLEIPEVERENLSAKDLFEN